MKSFVAPKVATPADKPIVAARLPTYQKLEGSKCKVQVMLTYKLYQ